MGRARIKGRAGFTLVELLVVIVIIGLLLALIFPAIGSARRKVNEARVTVDIKNLESAVTAFNAQYGMDPPSRFSIHLTEAGWTGDPASKAIVRRIWPQFDFTMPTGSFPAGTPSGMPNWNTIATNQGHAEYIGINSGECLMFFLGGVIAPAPGGTGTPTPIGFASNAAQPFNPTATNRKGPFLELDIARIKDTDNNGMSEYVDPLPDRTAPYLYFSSYDGREYRVGPAPKPDELPSGGPMLDVYRVYTGPAPAPAAGPSTKTLPPQKPKTFQIISPGYDGQHGLGGAINPQLPNSGLVDQRDFDNITNFSGGRIAP